MKKTLLRLLTYYYTINYNDKKKYFSFFKFLICSLSYNYILKSLLTIRQSIYYIIQKTLKIRISIS